MVVKNLSTIETTEYSIEELVSAKYELGEQIEELKEKRDELFSITELPRRVQGLKSTIEELSGKRDKIKDELYELYRQEKTDRTTEIEKEIAELTTHKEVLFKKIEEIKGENDLLETEREDINDSIRKSKIELSELTTKIDILGMEWREKKKELEKDCEQLELDKEEFRKKEAKCNSRLNGFENTKREITKEEQILEEKTRAFGKTQELFFLAKTEFEKEKKRDRIVLIEGGKSLAIEVENLEEKRIRFEKNSADLKNFRRMFEEREIKLRQREKDLDTNWTVFIKEKGKDNG